MVEVELDGLKNVSKELSQHLEQRLKVQVAVKGGALILPDVINGKKFAASDAKDEVKHALHSLGLTEAYHVHADQHQVRIVKVERKKKRSEDKGAPPSPSQSLPYLFP